MRIYYLLFMLVLFTSCISETSDRFPFRDKESGLWGYKNEEGQIILEPTYDYANPFREGLAFVNKGKQKYFIDKLGRFWFDLPTDASPKTELGKFQNGWFAYLDFDQKTRFIDDGGNRHKLTQDEGVKGIAKKIVDGCYIKQDNQLYSLESGALKGYRVQDKLDRSGYLMAYKTSDRSQHIIDLSGDIILTANENERFGSVLDGMVFKRWMDKDSIEHYAFCHAKNGKVSWEIEASMLDYLSGKRIGYYNDWLRVQYKTETVYYDKNGEEKLRLNNVKGDFGPFSEGYAEVGKRVGDNYQIGIMDKSGRVVMEPQFDRLEPFQDDIFIGQYVTKTKASRSTREKTTIDSWYVKATGEKLFHRAIETY